MRLTFAKNAFFLDREALNNYARLKGCNIRLKDILYNSHLFQNPFDSGYFVLTYPDIFPAMFRHTIKLYDDEMLYCRCPDWVTKETVRGKIYTVLGNNRYIGIHMQEYLDELKAFQDICNEIQNG